MIGRGQFEMGAGQWIDVGQTGVMALMVAALIAIMLILRGELRRQSGMMQAMSRSMGEQSDLTRRLEQVEEDVAHLAMDVDQMRRRDP